MIDHISTSPSPINKQFTLPAQETDMEKNIVIVLDCGATNVRAIAIDDKGQLLAEHAVPNIAREDPDNEDFTIWDIDEIMGKLSLCCQKVAAKVSVENVSSIGISTFGVDGAFVDAEGKLLAPVISWKCQRTIPVLDNMEKYFQKGDLFQKTGIGFFSFNTINKFIWYKENRPEVLDNASHWLFISSLIGQKLTGEFYTDHTMAGTSQLCDSQTQDFDTDILSNIGVSKEVFPPMKYAGEVVGKVNTNGAKLLGLPEGVEVKSVGHDTQFALFGAGMNETNAVLSSGTWEILMVKAKQVNLTKDLMDKGVTVEFDTVKGQYNVGIQWMASANVEWVKNTFFGDAPSETVYSLMIQDAMEASSSAIQCKPMFQPDEQIQMNGLNINTSRGEIAKAFFIALSEKLNEAVKLLEEVIGFEIESITCVGGGAKNAYWNQLKAEACKRPIHTIGQKETTVLGAAFHLLPEYGQTPRDVRKSYKYNFGIFEPSDIKIIA